jgi:ornithine cyclodeaminase
MSAVEEALAIQESGQFQMPDRLGMECGGDGNILLLMPCLTDEALSTKLVSVFPHNHEQGRPVIQGLVVLCNPSTGEILALLDGKALTALRTGAVTGVSVRHLAPDSVHTLGLVGCGVQAWEQVRHTCAARSVDRILLHSRSIQSRDAMAQRLSREFPNIEVQAAPSVESLVAESQILITATTARAPVLPDDPSLFSDMHCVAMGSFEADVREYPDAIFSRSAKVWVDTPHAQVESGELAIPLSNGILAPEQIQTLGSLIAQGVPPDRGEFGCTFFKSVGMALFDLQTAKMVYGLAKAAGLGSELEMD